MHLIASEDVQARTSLAGWMDAVLLTADMSSILATIDTEGRCGCMNSIFAETSFLPKAFHGRFLREKEQYPISSRRLQRHLPPPVTMDVLFAHSFPSISESTWATLLQWSHVTCSRHRKPEHECGSTAANKSRSSWISYTIPGISKIPNLQCPADAARQAKRGDLTSVLRLLLPSPNPILKVKSKARRFFDSY